MNENTENKLVKNIARSYLNREIDQFLLYYEPKSEIHEKILFDLCSKIKEQRYKIIENIYANQS